MFTTRYIIPILLFSFIYNTALAQKEFKSGSWSVNQSIGGYSLDKNNGDRNMTLEIKFDIPFKKKPQLLISISQLDADKDSNIRFKAEVILRSNEGFTLKVKTWSDSKIYSISGYWLAISD